MWFDTNRKYDATINFRVGKNPVCLIGGIMNEKRIPLEKSSFTNEEDERKIAEYAKRLESSSLVEDIKFREIAKSKEAIQEILRVILDEDNLIVLKSIEQKDITESIFHGVILDCLCKLSTGELVNIEMQIAFKNAPVKRMRYNQSAMTIAHSPKDKYFDYDKIPSIISIMFCEFDIFELKEPIYEVKRKVNNTEVESNNGVREIYVNLTSKVENGMLKELFSILTELDYMNKQAFPKLTETKIKYNNLKGGDRIMSGLTREIYIDGYETGEKRGKAEGIEAGKAEGVAEGILKAYIDMVKDKLISITDAAKRVGMPEDKFAALVK